MRVVNVRVTVSESILQLFHDDSTNITKLRGGRKKMRERENSENSGPFEEKRKEHIDLHAT